jgi:phage terminase small subunit
MGKGIALMFKERFDENFRRYAAACKAKEAAIRAGYSEHSAGSTSSIMMANPKIRDAITEGLRAQIGDIQQLQIGRAHV